MTLHVCVRASLVIAVFKQSYPDHRGCLSGHSWMAGGFFLRVLSGEPWILIFGLAMTFPVLPVISTCGECQGTPMPLRGFAWLCRASSGEVRSKCLKAPATPCRFALGIRIPPDWTKHSTFGFGLDDPTSLEKGSEHQDCSLDRSIPVSLVNRGA